MDDTEVADTQLNVFFVQLIGCLKIHYIIWRAANQGPYGSSACGVRSW